MRHSKQTGLPLLVSAGTIVGCIILASGCDGRASIPGSIAPTPTPAPRPAPPTAETYNLSGVVFEMTAEGRVPIEGVEVYCDSCGSPVGHTWVSTDAKGFYSLSWAENGVHRLYVTKAGYQIFDPAGVVRDQIDASVHGDTQFDIELVRR